MTEGAPRWGGARRLARIAFHSVLLVALPFMVGGLTAAFAEVSQVSQTLTGLVRVAGALLMPVLVVQVTSIGVKVQRERRALAALGPIPPGAVLAAVDRHVRVMTDKGMGLLFGGLVAVTLALACRFAELGMIAVLGLSTLYLVVAVGMALSTFTVARFEERLATRGGSIGREFSPVVAEAGDSVEERFHLERVPVPAGFTLRIHQELPPRLETESRHVVGADVSRRRVTLVRSLRRTPRGDYHIGPAEVAYSDLFGLTRVALAQAAGARLKVLPRMHPVALAETPRVLVPEDGVLTVLRRMPSEDYFRFRDYAPGDDTRRIHWKLSVKVGRLQVRLPETVPVVRRRVRLLLDNYLPWDYAPGDESETVLGDALDRLVEVWLSLARALTERGEDVTLALPTGDAVKPVEDLHCTRGTQQRWRDLGARARWQRTLDLQHTGPGTEAGQFLVVVTARFVPLPALPTGGRLTWVFLPAAAEIPGPVPGTGPLGSRLLFLSFAPGAEENGTFTSLHRAAARTRLEATRARLGMLTAQGSAAAEASLRARGEPVYRVTRSGAAYVLQGGPP